MKKKKRINKEKLPRRSRPQLTAGRNSLCAIAARRHAAAPDLAAAGSLTTDRAGRTARARCALRAAPTCAPACDASSSRMWARLCAARPPRRSRYCSPPIAAHSARPQLADGPPRRAARRRARSPPTARSAQSRLVAAPPRLTTRRRARSPPTGLVGGCSRLLNSAHGAAVRASGRRVVVLVRGACTARPPRRSRSQSPLIAARFALV